MYYSLINITNIISWIFKKTGTKSSNLFFDTVTYNAAQDAVENGDRFTETEVDRRVAELFLQDFHQCGIHLPEGMIKAFKD